MLSLHSLQSAPHRKKKRVGRGDASRGNYSGRGAKGQRSRSGGKKGLKLRGLKQSMMAQPKSRGFSSLNAPMQIVNIGQLEHAFDAGATVDAQQLVEKQLVRSAQKVVKILGTGALTKALTVHATAVSKSAHDAILKVGGTVTLVPAPTRQKRTKK